MNRNDWLNFEIYIGGLIESEKIKDAETLRRFSDSMHQQMELAVQDYADDEGIEDYDPVY